MFRVSRYGVENKFEQCSRPMGAYQIAWWLRKHRFSVQVVEFLQLLTADELVQLTLPFITEKTICIGLSRTFIGADGQLPENIVRAAWRLKVKFPHLKIVQGGQYPTPGIEKRLLIDKVFVGYGEDDFLKWCQEQKHKVALPNQLFDIKEQQHRFIEDDVILPGEMLPIELGRGCIFKCKFCEYSMIGKEKGTYLRHHQNLVDEMKYNKDTFGVDKYMFLDDTANEDYDKVKRFSNFRKDLGFEINWVGYCRADLIWAKPESAEHLRESGLISPHFGIESFHPKASQFIGKGWSGKKGRDWLPKLYHEIWKEQVNFRITMITGLPYEPPENIFETTKWWNADPLGHIHFCALGISPPPLATEVDKRSDLSKRAEEIGYTFLGKNDEGLWNWRSPWCSSDQARSYANNGIIITSKYTRPSAWALASAVNHGYELREAMELHGSEPPDEDGSKARSVKNRYIAQFAKHFNLPELSTLVNTPFIR